MLKCIDFTALSSLEMERPLSLRETFSLKTHVAMCSSCSNYRKQIKALRLVMQAYADGRAVTPEPADEKGE